MEVKAYNNNEWEKHNLKMHKERERKHSIQAYMFKNAMKWS